MSETLLIVGIVSAVVFVAVLLIEGALRPGYDPMRGYPPGAPTGTPHETTWHHKVHDATAPVQFLAIFAACLTLAIRLDGFWQLYTVLTAVVGLGLTIWTALAYQRDAANLGLVQRALLLVYWGWIVLLGIHLTIL